MNLHRTFIEDLTVVSRKMRTVFDARVKELGLTLARARILRMLSRDEAGAATQSSLAALLDIEGPTLVRLLDHLEAQGIIERCAVDGDRRAKQIRLTEDGTRMADRVEELAARFRTRALAGIPEEDLAVATRVFNAVIRNMEEAG